MWNLTGETLSKAAERSVSTVSQKARPTRFSMPVKLRACGAPEGYMRPPKVTSMMLNISSGLTMVAIVPPHSSASVTAISETSGRSPSASWQDR